MDTIFQLSFSNLRIVIKEFAKRGLYIHRIVHHFLHPFQCLLQVYHRISLGSPHGSAPDQHPHPSIHTGNSFDSARPFEERPMFTKPSPHNFQLGPLFVPHEFSVTNQHETTNLQLAIRQQKCHRSKVVKCPTSARRVKLHGRCTPPPHSITQLQIAGLCFCSTS